MRRTSSFLIVWTAAILALAGGAVFLAARSAAPAVTPAAAAVDAAQIPAPVTIHRIAVIGDSYTGGSAMGGSDPARNWVGIVARKLHEQGVEIEAWKKAEGGSGYVARGQLNVTFADLVPLAVQPDTEVVVFFGSRNDTGQAGIQDAVTTAIGAVRAISQQARIVVIGPQLVNGDPPTVLNNRDAVLAAAQAAGGVQFIDPIAEGWFAGADVAFIGTDGIHPTDTGHANMADRLAPRLKAEIEAPPAAE